MFARQRSKPTCEVWSEGLMLHHAYHETGVLRHEEDLTVGTAIVVLIP